MNIKYNWRDTQQYSILYKQNPSYGSGGNRHLGAIVSLLKEHNIKSILDFGCGQNNMLVNGLIKMFPNMKIVGYDPSLEDSQCTSTLTNQILTNTQIDFVISTDCLEHIPQEELPQCWEIFRRLNPKLAYHGICTRAARQMLPDGTNAHKTVQLGSWWKTELEREFSNFKVLKADIQRQHQYSTFVLKNNLCEY
jgi:trans-aconitate methyltransferase